MARQPRSNIAGIPQHIVQRGHNRQHCFVDEFDYRRYLTDLAKASERYGCRIHAYVLMSNHVHLLATPDECDAVSRMMQTLGTRYVRYFNVRHDRTGTLWEGRFYSSLVDTERYLLACYRYIELNPVRAALVDEPREYPWSSFQANALGSPDPVVTPHPEYLALGETGERRLAAYLSLFDVALEPEHVEEIRLHLRQQKALGSTRFQRRVETMLGRPVEWRPPHRPRRK